MRRVIWLLLCIGLTACDTGFESGPQNRGNVSITGDEGLLVGEGSMVVGSHKLTVGHGRIKLDGVDYGVAPDAYEVVLRVNGDYPQVLVNGESRGKTKK